MIDLSQIAEHEWNEAYRRSEIVRPLLEFKRCPRNRAHEAAIELGLSDRQVYRLIQRLRESDGKLLLYCRVAPTAGGVNNDWLHHAKICSSA
ncbi:MAG: hypothetical protein WCP01_02500 [Methylococcaceae bacterium]|jgi:putative transposase